MTTTPPTATLVELARRYGVSTEFWDWRGRHTIVSAETIRAVLAAIDVAAGDDDAAARSLIVADERAWRRMLAPFTLGVLGSSIQVQVRVPDGSPTAAWLELEDRGGRRDLRQLDVWVDPREVDGSPVGVATFEVPSDVPLGWHTVYAQIPGAGTQPQTGDLVVVPAALELPAQVATEGAFGLQNQLYSVRSRRSWGVGDLGDLADLTVWAARDLGADFMLINPVHAAEFAAPMEPSPYLPTSRRFVNPLYIRVEDLPEVGYLPTGRRAEVAALASRAQRMNVEDTIDRSASWTLKKEALRLVFDEPRGPRRQAAFEAYCENEGRGLLDFATWCVLGDHVARDQEWPQQYLDPHAPAVEAFRETHHDEVVFAMWCQWVVDDQLAAVQREALAAGMSLGVMQDLAVGTHPQGADAWSLGDALARGVTVGAPPDDYSQLGQDWSQPPWRPDRLEELGYRPFRDMIRAALRHSGGLRIDHIIGLFRLWWIPQGMAPIDGTYVRFDHDVLIGILVLEAARAESVIVGEDLGTVEPWVRDYLHRRGILGTSILWFERDEDGVPLEPEAYRRLCLASVTTHDLPPSAGYLTAEHVRVRDDLGLFTRPVAQELQDARADRARVLDALAGRGLLSLLAGADSGAACAGGAAGGNGWSDVEVERNVEGIVEALYRYLSWSPALLVGVAVPDLVGDRRAMNQPGTSDEYPNWRLPLAGRDRRPVLLEDLIASRGARRLARCVQRGHRTTS